jgi:BirA family transcriptional regulator, biotin operon repressor / biotin---[acetyl-CoA-carboxylase] ligase
VTLPDGWRLERHEALASTSDQLIRRAEAGEAEGLAILARHQAAGRGRGGRGWDSPPGNLYLSVLLRPSGPVREAAQWGLLAGVALIEAARELDPDPAALRLKWPNDLLRRGAKCAGILAESSLAPGGGLAWLVLGFGVNLAAAPALPDRATAPLGRTEPPERFAARLLRRLDHWRVVQRGEGFAPVRAAWEAAGPARGEAILARVGTEFIAGDFAGLGGDGSLRLNTADGLRTIAGGEVLATAAPAEEAS